MAKGLERKKSAKGKQGQEQGEATNASSGEKVAEGVSVEAKKVGQEGQEKGGRAKRKQGKDVKGNGGGLEEEKPEDGAEGVKELVKGVRDQGMDDAKSRQEGGKGAKASKKAAQENGKKEKAKSKKVGGAGVEESARSQAGEGEGEKAAEVVPQVRRSSRGAAAAEAKGVEEGAETRGKRKREEEKKGKQKGGGEAAQAKGTEGKANTVAGAGEEAQKSKGGKRRKLTDVAADDVAKSAGKKSKKGKVKEEEKGGSRGLKEEERCEGEEERRGKGVGKAKKEKKMKLEDLKGTPSRDSEVQKGKDGVELLGGGVVGAKAGALKAEEKKTVVAAISATEGATGLAKAVESSAAPPKEAPEDEKAPQGTAEAGTEDGAQRKKLKKKKLAEVRAEKSAPPQEPQGQKADKLDAGPKDVDTRGPALDEPAKKGGRIKGGTPAGKEELAGAAGGTAARAFQRVKVEEVKFKDPRLQNNSYWAKGGADAGWGAKAQEVLGQVRGKDFRHEKTKKKRGSYRGGAIDLSSHSIKFADSDDE